MRTAVGVVVAAAALAGAALATRATDERRVEAVRTEVGKAAVASRQKAEDAVRTYVKALEVRASAAASLRQIAYLLDRTRGLPLDEELAGTWRDVFGKEAYWSAYRRDFPVYGVSRDEGDLQFVHGALPRALSARALLREARERDVASAVIVAAGMPYAAAAATVQVPSLAQQGMIPVLLLARPLDDDAVREIGDRAGAAVLITDGKRVLARNGPRDEMNALATAVGHERTGTHIVAGGADGAAVLPLAEGVWLWVHATAVSAARDAESAARTTRTLTWAGGALVALAALVLGLRRRPPVPANAATAPGLGPQATTPPLSTSAPAHAVTTMAAGASPPPPGTAGQPFGRYLLLEQLGEGGMSQVYTAVTYGAEGFRRKFVIKRLRPELAQDPVVVAQFTDEANLASSLVHSNIVPVFDFGKVGGEYFLATEYILGRDLSRVVHRIAETTGRAIPMGIVLHCAHETLKALDYAHAKLGEDGHPLGLVHRDVSPANVLVSARGEVKLFDFGIVKAEGRVTRTQAGVVKGNVSFMSPEQARGIEIDARADLFSLGLVMYYCLTGEVLYTGNTTYELLIKAATGPGAEDKARVAGLPGPAAALVARALEVDPARRFQSASEFAAAVAPLSAPGRELAEVMQSLFAADFREEERRFASVRSTTAAGEAGGPTRSGTRQT